MVSFWWLFLAFMGGGFAGLLVTALMRMSGELPEQPLKVPDLSSSLDHDPLGRVTQW